MMTVKGTVVDTFTDEWAAWVIVDRGDGMKKSLLAVRCYGKDRTQQAGELNKGDRVEIVGDLRSNPSKKDPNRWFTNFEAVAIKVVDAAGKASTPGGGDPDGDDMTKSDIPF